MNRPKATIPSPISSGCCRPRGFGFCRALPFGACGHAGAWSTRFSTAACHRAGPPSTRSWGYLASPSGGTWSKKGRRPRTKRKRSQKPEPRRQRPELRGLKMVAFGLFMATVLYTGWNRGCVGGSIAERLQGPGRLAGFRLPILFVIVGRAHDGSQHASRTCSLPPGLLVLTLGLLFLLGHAHGDTGAAGWSRSSPS